MTDFVLPYEIKGTVIDSRNRILKNTEVSLINATKSSNPLIVLTDLNGFYVADAANFNTQYSANDSINIEVYNSFRDEYKLVTFTITGTKKTQNIQTEVISSLQKGTTGYPVQNILTNVNKKPYTKENPIPTEQDERKYTEAFAALQSDPNKVEYIGQAFPGSLKTEAKWRIKKITYSGDFTTDVQWAKGNDYFDKIWNDRELYLYS